MGNTLKKKKGFSMPHVYAVILILMLLVTIMTYVIPAGTYARVDGNVDPNSFTYVEQTPVSFLSFFTSLHQGFVESANVIGAVLLISGAIQIIQKTGAFSAGIQALIKRAKGRDLVMVLLFFTIFTGMGVIGYLDALYPFYPIIISLFITLGYDKMVGTAIIMLSTAVGFTCGMVNPYTTGVAQTLVGLPMYSGIALRAVGLVVFYAIAVFFLTRYCIKIKKNPKYSVMGENYLQEQTAPMQFEEGLDFHGRRVAIIVVFLAAILSLQEMEDLRDRRDQSAFRKEFNMIGSRLVQTGKAWFRSQGIILFITTGLCIGGMFLIRNPYYIMAGIGILDALPIFGTGTVLIPWAVLRLAVGDWKQALVLTAIYLVCYFVRQILEVRMMGGQVGLSPLETLASVYVGLELFGFFGFILGPLGLLLIEDMVEAWTKEEETET
jgi:uncharacterized ion transporter superfamily protein YfcC